MQIDYNILLETIKQCGDISKKYYFDSRKIKYLKKKDGSKVTQAEIEINNFLKEELAKKYPKISFFSEEEEENIKNIINNDFFFIIDPIDGTNSFVEKKEEYTINLSLVFNKKIICSFIYLPIKNILYFTKENESFKLTDNKMLKLNNSNNKLLDEYRVITTRRNDELSSVIETLKEHKINYTLSHFSSALKFCIIAEGGADLYIRRANIKLWDVISGFDIASNANFFIKDGGGNNILEYLLDKNYLSNIYKNEFRICEFVVQNTDELKFIF